MKRKLSCILFGHDFRIMQEEKTGTFSLTRRTFQSDWCRKCGLTKEEIGITNRSEKEGEK